MIIMLMIMIIIIDVIIIYYYGEDDDDDDAVSLQVGSTEARGRPISWRIPYGSMAFSARTPAGLVPAGLKTAQPPRSTRLKSALFFQVSWTTSSWNQATMIYSDLQWSILPWEKPQALGRQSQHLPCGPRGRKSAAI